MSEHIHKAADRVRRFLDARGGYFPIDVLAVVTRTGDRLLVSDLRALVDALARVEALADEWGWMTSGDETPSRLEMYLALRASLSVACATCSGRGVWMDEPCVDCAPFCCYPCARGDHDEHKLAWVPDIPCECPKCASLPGGGL